MGSETKSQASCCGGAAVTERQDRAAAAAVPVMIDQDLVDQGLVAPAVVDQGEAGGSLPEGDSCCAGDNQYGYADHKLDYLRRLRRIEGQVRGLQRMVEEDQYCIDILTQISAATKALESTALRLLDEHLSHCVTHAIEAGGQEADDKLAEASAAIARLVRS